MIGTARAIAKGGAGVLRDGERTVFVPGVIAGETIEFTLAGRRRGAWLGELQRVLEPSPQRRQPPCPHFGDCGGCNLQHMSYGEQLRSKREILEDNLRRIAGVELEPPPGVLPSPPERYRSRVEFQLRAGAAGFFARESHRVVPIQGCLLLPRAVEEFFLSRRQGLAGLGAGQLQVVSNGRELAARLLTDGLEEWPAPRRAVDIAVGPHQFRFAPDNFVQANLFQLRPMQELLEGVLERERPATAADLFCGAGFFTLPLAARCRDVLAVESEAGHIASLRANLERNGAGRVRVLQADILRSAPPRADLFVVDPPRGGLSGRLIAALAAAPTVVYFSCDSATFARDLRLLRRHGLGLEELLLVDNFPQSDHFEIFSVFKGPGGQRRERVRRIGSD